MQIVVLWFLEKFAPDVSACVAASDVAKNEALAAHTSCVSPLIVLLSR
jgi:hypothetical protein